MPKKDASQPIRKRASEYPEVIEGTSCSQDSFKIGKSAFLYIGLQNGRHKAMFKLDESRDEAALLASREPENFQVGSTAWVTARFSDEDPLPTKLWKQWLDESYQLSLGTPKRVAKKTARKKTAKVSRSRSEKTVSVPTKAKKSPAKKKVAKKKATRKRRDP